VSIDDDFDRDADLPPMLGLLDGAAEHPRPKDGVGGASTQP
jgi:hypothetical protein